MNGMIIPPQLRTRPLTLELGCAGSKRLPESIGVDILDVPGVDIACDALELLESLPDKSVRHIYSEHFLEHIADAEKLVRESSRVLEEGGTFVAVVPHFSNPMFYSDPTHRTFFGLYTFSYWASATPWRRGTPQYESPMPLRLEGATFRFKSSRPFYVRHGVKKALAAWVNCSRWSKEFYEEHLPWIMPAYEIEYRLRRI